MLRDGPLTGAPLGFPNPSGGGPVTLQNAYDAGNTIVTSALRPLAVTGSEDTLLQSSAGGQTASFVTTAAGVATCTASLEIVLSAGTQGIRLAGAGAGLFTCASPVEVRQTPGGAFQNVRGADPVSDDDLATKRYVDGIDANNLAPTGLFTSKTGQTLNFRGITSTGGTVTITTPDANTINLESAGGGGGITPAQHETLRQLIHFIHDGPGNGFATGAYKEILPSGSPFPNSFVWWESAAKTNKIVELQITRNANQTPASEQWTMYSGGAPVGTVTDAITYASNVFEVSRTQTIVP